MTRVCGRCGSEDLSRWGDVCKACLAEEAGR